MSCERKIVYMFLCYLVVAVFSVRASSADTNEMTVEEFVKARMERIRVGQAQGDGLSKLMSVDRRRAYHAMLPYAKDPNTKVRAETMLSIMRIRENGVDPTLNKSILETLVRMFRDGFEDQNRHIRGRSLFFIRRFKCTDFTETARETVRRLFREKDLSRDTLKLYSIANMKEDLPELKKVFEAKEWPPDDPEDELWPRSLKWKFRRVMAQFGDEESIAYCISRVENEKRPAVRVSAIADLTQIHHHDVVNLLADQLASEEMIKGLHDSYPVSGHAVHALTQLLGDFPVTTKRGPIWYSKTDIAQCRKWMLEQTEWKFKEF